MRIVVWGINYAPEITGISPHNVALCEFLHGAGHVVEMVSTFAYYPEWSKRPEDRGKIYRTDRINDVPVHRCWHYVPHRVTPLKRIFHEGTFVFFSTLRVLALPKPDVYVVVSPPLLLGAAAWLVSLIKGAPFVFHVQDLQPDAAVGLGMLKEGWLTRALFALERFAYEKATKVSGISPEIIAAFRRKGVPEGKLILYPNSVELPDLAQLPARGHFRAKHSFATDDFLAIYAGNLGVKQGLDVLIDAARELSADPRIRIVLCGNGAARPELARRIEESKLANISLLPLQRGRDYEELLADADLSLITQQSGSGNSFFPSKLLVTLAHLSPVLTVADFGSALADAVQTGGFGLNVAPSGPGELAAALRRLSGDKQQLADWSRAGRSYVEQFDRSRVISAFVRELQHLA